MRRTNRSLFLLLWSGCLAPGIAFAQVDPVPRELVQLGYNASLEGHAPLAAYAFYLLNRPDFPRTNLTLRLAVAPTYLDTELGIRHALSEDTDLGLGVAGGGFADSYDEIRGGTFIPRESFVGHGGETSLSLYHCFNPDQRIPLNGVVRGVAHYSFYERDDGTDPTFKLPPDHGSFIIRTGLRWGGKEPTLFPSLAMELSIWYEGVFRTASGRYGDTTLSPAGDRQLEARSHLFWEQALLAYTFPKSQQSFFLSLTAGTSLTADRFSTYRLGSLLPMVSEFPLALPGYFYEEISARQFVLVGGNYIAPLDKARRWNLTAVATGAAVDYLGGLSQPGNLHCGVGGGLLYQGRSLKVMLGYAYGVEAIRNDHRGSQTVGILMQLDLEHAKGAPLSPQPGIWRGFQRVFSAVVD